jgi:hypothetical protein
VDTAPCCNRGSKATHTARPSPAVLPHWGGVTPFLLTSTDQFELAGPPALTSAEFANDLNEVQTLGVKHSSTRTDGQYSHFGDGCPKAFMRLSPFLGYRSNNCFNSMSEAK